MTKRDICPSCHYALASPMSGGDPFQRVGCHRCGTSLGCTRPCYMGDAMYSDGSFGGGDLSTCCEANAPFTLMSIAHEPAYGEKLEGYLCPSCADAMMRGWAEKPDDKCRFAIVPGLIGMVGAGRLP